MEIVRDLPWWGLVSAVLAPVLLIGGWTVAADLQPVPFDPVTTSISTLAAEGTPYRWLITIALLGVGACDVLTGLALRPATGAGPAVLITGGVCGVLVALNAQPRHGSSVPHEVFAAAGIVLLTIWPVAAIRRDRGAPPGLRPAAGYGAAAVTLALALWFAAQLPGGEQLGLAERALTAGQALWPLVVTLSVLIASRQAYRPPSPDQRQVSL